MELDTAGLEDIVAAVLQDAAQRGDFEALLLREVEEMFASEGATGVGGRWPKSRGAEREGRLTLTDSGRMRESAQVRFEIHPTFIGVLIGFSATNNRYEYPLRHTHGRGVPVRNPGFVHSDSQGKGLDMDKVIQAFYYSVGEVLNG